MFVSVKFCASVLHDSAHGYLRIVIALALVAVISTVITKLS